MLDSLAACLRCLPQSDHAAKFFFTLMEICSCCWACGEVVNPARPVVHEDRDTRLLKHPRKGGRGELAALSTLGHRMECNGRCLEKLCELAMGRMSGYGTNR